MVCRGPEDEAVFELKRSGQVWLRGERRGGVEGGRLFLAAGEGYSSE